MIGNWKQAPSDMCDILSMVVDGSMTTGAPPALEQVNLGQALTIACLFVSIHTQMTYIHIYIYMYICIHAYIRRYKRSRCRHIHICIYIYSYICIYTQLCTLTHRSLYM